MPVSETKTSRLALLEHQQFDVVVVGGGIIGAGIARDAALRGLRVALFEKHDFGSGTTAGSTRLIHGGLRYLEMLDFRLVRMDLRERETLLRIAPHLVKPLEFIMPFYGRNFYYRSKMKIGMALYDLLSYDKTLPRHRFLKPNELKEIEPNLQQNGLQGAAAYFDAQVNSPERLCLENIIDACEHGAQAFNHTEVIGALRTGEAIDGVRVRDLLDNDSAMVSVKSRLVINASGAWFDRVAGRLTEVGPNAQIRTTKGIHITCPPVAGKAVVVFSAIDDRLMFLIPWLGYSWIGTTDTDFKDDPATVYASARDVDYVLRSISKYFPTLDTSRIYFSNAGVRALVRKEGSESAVSRMHRIANGRSSGAKNLISVIGGKITGYRAIAEEVTDLICNELNVKEPCVTSRNPLPGARLDQMPVSSSTVALSIETVEHLSKIYGSRACQVIDLAASCERLREPLSPNGPDIAAQVIFAARSEHCLRLVDFILRRTLLGFSHDQGKGAVDRVLLLLEQELAWSPERTSAELTLYQNYISMTQAFRGEAQV